MIPLVSCYRIRVGGVLFTAVREELGCAVYCGRSGAWWHCGPTHCAAYDVTECVCGREPRRGVALAMTPYRSINRPIQSLPSEAMRAGYEVHEAVERRTDYEALEMSTLDALARAQGF